MAAARAAARRQAILNSRGDRLAKLTSSARGDDPGGVYADDDPPLPTLGTGLKNFVGEETELPTPPVLATASPSSKSQPQPHAETTDAQFPSWIPEQQQEFLRTLMSRGLGAGQPGPASSTANASANSSAPPVPEDPISALLATLSGGTGSSPFNAPAPPPRPKSRLQRLIPLLHALSMLAVLVWFVGWKEPKVWNASAVPPVDTRDNEVPAETRGLQSIGWRRWAILATAPPAKGGLVVPPLPAFFWAFTTLQLALHSTRLFSQRHEYRPPMLVGLALPYLPAPLPQAIPTLFKYLQMGSLVLDDLSILLFGIGLVIVMSNWAT